MRGNGEPVSKGRLTRAADAQALRDTVLMVGLVSGVVLVNGILAILFIALMQALGLWGPTAEALSSESAEWRSSLEAVLQRHTAPDSPG